MTQVVDTFADARQNDMQNLAEEMEDEIQHDRKTLAKLFARIDADGSGQAQEFIGPLSRWAHDSKTAPRFIKYNLMQTMKIQEDLYDLCEDCFKHLALQIDKVFGEIKSLKEVRPTSRSATPATPRSPHEAPESKSFLDELEINASKEVGQLLVEKKKEEQVEKKCKSQGAAQVLTFGQDAAISVVLERAVADLQASLQRLEVFSVDANEMIKKWAELPIDLNRKRHQDNSTTGSAGAKADLFWAHYMDRERDLAMWSSEMMHSDVCPCIDVR
eukprot:Skav202528  [mRNA]  locus=scaffold2011:93086:94627:- [translate_table: standard]